MVMPVPSTAGFQRPNINTRTTSARVKFTYAASAHFITPEYGFEKPPNGSVDALARYAERVADVLAAMTSASRNIEYADGVHTISGLFNVAYRGNEDVHGVEFRLYEQEGIRQFGADLLGMESHRGDKDFIALVESVSEKYIMWVYRAS